MCKLAQKIPSTTLCSHCPWFAPEYYLGVFTVSYWKPQSALYFFSPLLFKANGSENEQSTVTQAKICDDLENRQMEKGGSCQPQAIAAPNPLGSECHTGLPMTRGVREIECTTGRFGGWCVSG
jgi:hypothetical protein